MNNNYKKLVEIYNNTNYTYNVQSTETVLLVGSDKFIKDWLSQFSSCVVYDYTMDIPPVPQMNTYFDDADFVLYINGNVDDLDYKKLNTYLEDVEGYLKLHKGIKIIGLNHMPTIYEMKKLIRKYVYRENVFIDPSYDLTSNEIFSFDSLDMKFIDNDKYEIFKHIKLNSENTSYLLQMWNYGCNDFTSYNYLILGQVNEVKFGPFKICHVKVGSNSDGFYVLSYIINDEFIMNKYKVMMNKIWEPQQPITTYEEEVELMKYLIYYNMAYNIIDEQNKIRIIIHKFKNNKETMINKKVEDLTKEDAEILFDYQTYLYNQINWNILKFCLEPPVKLTI